MRLQGSGFRVQGVGLKVQGLGFKVQGVLGFRFMTELRKRLPSLEAKLVHVVSPVNSFATSFGGRRVLSRSSLDQNGNSRPQAA